MPLSVFGHRTAVPAPPSLPGQASPSTEGPPLPAELAQQYPAGQRDSSEAAALLQQLTELSERLQPRLLVSDNRVKLMELQRDLAGCDALLTAAEAAGRRFVREGCLQKLSKKGYQHRMFFLVRLRRGGRAGDGICVMERAGWVQL